MIYDSFRHHLKSKLGKKKHKYIYLPRYIILDLGRNWKDQCKKDSIIFGPPWCAVRTMNTKCKSHVIELFFIVLPNM